MSKRKRHKPAPRPPFNPPRVYARCDRCVGQGYLYTMQERVAVKDGKIVARRRRLDIAPCTACCAVGSTVKPGDTPPAPAIEITIPRIVQVERLG